MKKFPSSLAALCLMVAAAPGQTSQLVRDINDQALPAPAVQASMVRVNPGSGEILVIAVEDALNGAEIWKSDGTPAGTALIEGSIPRWDPVTHALTWSDGGPPFGQQYAIIGTKFDEYYVWDRMPADRNEHQGAPLPKRVPLRKWDLFGR